MNSNTNPVGNPVVRSLDDDDPADHDSRDQFDRFHDLASKLVQVPKTDPDEKRSEG